MRQCLERTRRAVDSRRHPPSMRSTGPACRRPPRYGRRASALKADFATALLEEREGSVLSLNSVLRICEAVGSGPRLTLPAAIDDAVGRVAGADWREREDSVGYLALVAERGLGLLAAGVNTARPEVIGVAMHMHGPTRRRPTGRASTCSSTGGSRGRSGANGGRCRRGAPPRGRD
jgi:hypothetical protein